MQLQTILNRVHKIKGFVYRAVRYGEWDPTLEVEVRPRAGQGAVLKRSRWLFLKRAENLTAE